MTEHNFNHRELCEIGAKWLKRPSSANGHGCQFAIIEPSCYGENPDVFGVRHGCNGYDIGTVLLEAKTSRSDFLADRNKPHRQQPHTGIGKWRYFICPKDLIKPHELPEKWGLIYVSPKGICKIIVGAMAVPKEYKTYSGARYADGNKLRESFISHSFNERHIQNEYNLLAMALARLDDVEQILYMQRDHMRLKQRNFELEQENKSLNHYRLRFERTESIRGAVKELSQ